MPISEAQKKAAQKYDSKNMSTIAMKMPIAERENIENAATKAGLKLATYCRACIKYCIENDIDLRSE